MVFSQKKNLAVLVEHNTTCRFDEFEKDFEVFEKLVYIMVINIDFGVKAFQEFVHNVFEVLAVGVMDMVFAFFVRKVKYFSACIYVEGHKKTSFLVR